MDTLDTPLDPPLKLAGGARNGASVMVGRESGVVTKIKDIVPTV